MNSVWKKIDLPVAAIADRVNRCLDQGRIVVVTAPPGAGKSTLLPLALLEATPAEKILLLEPRRLAARQVALRMASLLGEEPGQTVGYRIRFETKVSAQTRLEVLTEGILERMLVEDPTLEGVSALIFDEFHERSLTTDLSLALARESRQVLRPDLKLLLMSATLEADDIARRLDAEVVASEGRMFPVEIRRSETLAEAGQIAEAVAHVVRQAHREAEGDILAFLPGEADIRRCEALLENALGDTALCPLYGNLPPAEQQRAIAPSPPGRRKVVLATPIAETSLTIEGVRVVVDSGWHRKLLHNAQNGLDRLETVRISRDMAIQRAGRAGRVAPGRCYRLWNAAVENTMAPTRVPEILEADLCPLCLSVAAWGESRPERLPWLTPPPAANLARAQALLRLLDAFDEENRLTPYGRRLSALPCHPRVARMLVSAEDAEAKALAADVAALLEEKDPMAADNVGSPIHLRLNALREARRRQRLSGPWLRIEQIARQYREMVRVERDDSPADPFDIGRLVALAWPERIASRIGGAGSRYATASGETVTLDPSDENTAYPWLAIASLNTRNGGEGRVFLASAVDAAALDAMATDFDNLSWDARTDAVTARRERRLGRLLLSSSPLNASRAQLDALICEACRKDGAALLDFSDEVENLQRRVQAVTDWHPELGLPDLSTETVLATVDQWLPMYLGKASSKAELKKIDLSAALWGLLSYEQQQAVERLAPSHLVVPTGSRLRVEYRRVAEAPVLRVRLQECFGLVDTPRVDDGRRPVLMELLSPGYKPVQLTQDLRSFWENAYFEVKKELKRRYPKHAWPDNPVQAEAVRGAVRRKSD